MNKVSLLIVLSIVLLASCKRQSLLSSDKKETLEIINPDFEYLTSKAKFKFEHNDKKVSATANFRIQKDSLIWLSITPGLGLEVARVLINRNQVFVLDKLNKKYYEYDFKELSKQYGFEFDFGLIQSVILGNLSEPYRNQNIEKSDKYFSFQTKKGPVSYQQFCWHEIA